VQSHAVRGLVKDGDVEPGTKTDSTLMDLLDQITGAEVLVTITVLKEPCLSCVHHEEGHEHTPATG
jgi:hypothetical protein